MKLERERERVDQPIGLTALSVFFSRLPWQKEHWKRDVNRKHNSSSFWNGLSSSPVRNHLWQRLISSARKSLHVRGTALYHVKNAVTDDDEMQPRSRLVEGICLWNSKLQEMSWTVFGEKGDIWTVYFSPTAKLAMGSLAQNSSGAIRCSCNPRFRRRFRKVPEGSGGVQMADEVPDGSGADSRQGSGRLRCRWLMRFRMVPVSIANTVLEGSGAESWWGSGGFRAESWLGSGGFRCRWLMRFRMVPAHIADKVPVQIADKVLEGSGAESWWSSGGFRCRKLMSRRVPD